MRVLCSFALFLCSLTRACPPPCVCEGQSVTCTGFLGTSLRLSHLPVKEVTGGSFQGLINVSRIEISQSDSIRRIKYQAFLSLHSLTEILIQNLNNLLVIEKGAFMDLPKLKYLSICNTGLIQFPELTTIASTESLFLLELGDNMQLDSLPPNSFVGMAEEYAFMNLFRNGFRDIHHHAFNGTKLDKLILRENRMLTMIHDDAFDGATGPILLDVSFTALRFLPARGLQHVKVLRARSTPALKSLPPLENLQSLQEAQLTYPSHCCAFHTWHRQNRDGALLRTFGNVSLPCRSSPGNPSEVSVAYTEDDYPALDFHYPDLELCPSSAPISCTPEPDAFNPCEDLLGFGFLRLATWLVTVLAIGGNLAVLVMLLCGRHKLTVPRFLVCHLAFADLCTGVYLLLIATADLRWRRRYYNHATAWQTGSGCRVAGFLTVFASELSVYTLTAVTLERWHTITHAMRLERRLRLRQVAAAMAGGWGFSLLAALLPVLGVSSYSKVSICLPMDIESVPAQAYVVVLLLLNVAAFFTVCACYTHIYLAVQYPSPAARRGDATIAKRMAVLVFTDFLCMAPISFFALSAALRVPLITVSHSKILLVLFYPINSICNPFLYTISTKAFRRDLRALLAQCGCYCTDKPSRPGREAPPQKPGLQRFYAYHLKMRGCFLSRSPK